jgi:hypothetical protein
MNWIPTFSCPLCVAQEFLPKALPCGGDRVIGNRAGITASLRVRECMSTADRVGFVVLVAGEAKCHCHDEPSDYVGAT